MLTLLMFLPSPETINQDFSHIMDTLPPENQTERCICTANSNIVYHQLLILVSNTSIILSSAAMALILIMARHLLCYNKLLLLTSFQLCWPPFVRLRLKCSHYILCIILTISGTGSFLSVIRSDLFFINSVPSVPGYNVSQVVQKIFRHLPTICMKISTIFGSPVKFLHLNLFRCVSYIGLCSLFPNI